MRIGILAASVALSLASSFGCGSSDDDDTPQKPGASISDPNGSGGKAAAAGSGGVTAMTGSGGKAPTGMAGAGGGGGTTTTGSGGMAMAGSGGMAMMGSGGMTTMPSDGEGPPAANLPTAKGECPTFAGDGDYTFNVQGGRQVLIWVDASKAPASGKGGPVIFYWHGTTSSPNFETLSGLGQATISDVKNQGGLVAGFYSTMNHADKGTCDECKSDTGNGVWFQEDFNLADEVLACAIAQLHVDTSRIHVSGMSAGGLQTTAMLYSRSNYLASAAPYSGGAWVAGQSKDPANNVPAMIFHGTYDKDIVGIHFYATSKILFNDIKGRGALAIDCNHGGGHMIPGDGGAAVWKFFQAHPYRAEPSPWATMLPAGLPSYCSLTFKEEDCGECSPF